MPIRAFILTGLLLLSALPLSYDPVSAGPLNRLRPARLPRAAVGPVADPAASDLLRRMLQAENTLALDGDQITVVSRNGLDISSEQRVQRDGARALRLDYLRPARLTGEQVVDNGRFYCHLVPAKDTLEIGPSRIGTLRVRVPQVIREVRDGRLLVSAAGQDTVAGRSCLVLQVITRSAGPAAFQKFWIDPTNGAQLRNEQYDSAGRLLSASYYTQITYNPVFDKTAFRLPAGGGKVAATGFDAPALTLDQVRAQAGFPVLAPTALPPGFRYGGGSVSDRRAYRVAALRYVSGANALSVFETPDKPGGVSRAEHPRRGVLLGRQSGLKVVVIGNLSNAELDAVLNSLR